MKYCDEYVCLSVSLHNSKTILWMMSCFQTWPESSMTLYLEGLRQVATPVGRQTSATVFGRVCQNVAPGVKSAD